MWTSTAKPAIAKLGAFLSLQQNGVRFTYPDSGVSVLVDVPDGREGPVFKRQGLPFPQQWIFDRGPRGPQQQVGRPLK